MICPNCGSEIPSDFHFCGMCGEPLPVAEVPANAAAGLDAVAGLEGGYSTPGSGPEPAEAAEYAYSDETHPPDSDGQLSPDENIGSHEAAISGPSFLGLSEGGTDSEGSYSYLLEDEPRRSHFSAIVLVITLAILGAVAWRNWGAIESYVAHVRRPPATVYPNAADHSDTGLTSDVKPPEHSAVAPDQQVDANSPSNAGQPQMTVEEQQKQSARDGNRPADAPSERAAEASSGAEPPPSPSADRSTRQETPSDAASSVEDKQPAPPPKPARARAVTEKQPTEKQPNEEPGARMLMLGENYLYGRTVPRNCGQAVIYLKAAADAGNAAARSHLGALYSTGECVARDRVVAYHWFALASRTEPANPWLESNLNMLWRDMSPDERRRVGTER